MSKTPRGSSSSSTKQPNLYALHQQQVALAIRERDAEIKQNGPIAIRTAFGLWQFGLGGTSSTTYDVEPHKIGSKQKYRRA
jgi:hypothetical protein